MDRCTQDDLEIPLHKGNETPLKRMHLDQFAYKRLTRSAMKRKRIPERVLGRPKIGTGTCAADVNLRGENPFSSIAKGTLDGMCPVVKRRKRPVRGSHAKKEPPVHGIEPSTKHRASALSPSPALSQTCPKRTEDKSQTQRPSGASAGAARSAVADTEVRPQAGIQAVALSNRTDPPSRDFAQYLGSMHPLRVVFVGHNPSDTSWRHSQPYAHKSNRFWRLVGESGLVPVNVAQPHHFAQLPEAVGVGFVDLYVTSGSDASCVKGDQGATLRRDVCTRVLNGTNNVAPLILCCVSKIVAKKLLAGWSGGFGPAGVGRDWQLHGLRDVLMWVLPSTSGRAVMTWEQRISPFRELKAYLTENTAEWV